MDPWFSIAAPRRAARVRLFCFPHAGGGASSYFAWSRAVADTIEVCAVQPPGRENRLREAPFTALEPLIESLAEAIAPLTVGRSYAFFGHSMGATVAFELTRTLRARGVAPPSVLFVSGAHAPDLTSEEEPLHPINDDIAFLEAVSERYGAVPAIVLANAELRSLVVPALRADLHLLESYTYREALPVTVDIAGYRGSTDAMVKDDRLTRWAVHTTGAFSSRTFEGGHFYLNDVREALVADIASRLQRHL